FYMSARHYLASRDNKTGVALLEQAVALGPDIINLQDAHERMGLMYLQDPGRFVDFITPTVQQFPASIPLEVFNLVYISVNPETPGQREARDRLNAIGIHLEVAQWIGKAYNNLGMGLYDNGETTRAIAAYQHSLRFLPNRATTLMQLAQALQKQGNQPASTAAMLRAAQIAPHDQSTLYNATVALFIQGKTARAVEYCLAALELQPHPKLYSLLGTCYRQLGEQEQAITAYRQSIALAPKNFIAYAHLANIFERPQAIKTLEQALAAGIEHAEIYKRLGRLYFEQGEAIRAAELHRRAIAIAPNDVQTHTNLGTILKTLGQWQEAHRAYEQANTLEPHNPAHLLEMAELTHILGKESVPTVRDSIETH
ncbi:MAG TPA: tetratricopeptide repeat protein, partial [Candidatus Latescibacteria bacterium]|nr:tetratricopeptide repeat protein [Candidatus Latescibacterota bacterium]